MSQAIRTWVAIAIGAALTVLNAVAWLSSIGLLSIALAVAPVIFGAWGYPFAQRRGDSPCEALTLACLYAAALAFVLLAPLALVPRI